MRWVQPIKQEPICSATEARKLWVRQLEMERKGILHIGGICTAWMKEKDNLFVAIAIPLRSLIKPMRAYFTASVRNAESGVDSRVTRTWSFPHIAEGIISDKIDKRQYSGKLNINISFTPIKELVTVSLYLRTGRSVIFTIEHENEKECTPNIDM